MHLNKPLVHLAIAPIAVLAAGLTAAAWTFLTLEDAEYESARRAFAQVADARLSTIEQHIRGQIETVESTRAFLSATGEISRKQFNSFATRLLDRYPGYQTLEWVPRVAKDSRAAVEQAARLDGFPNFEFTEREITGELAPASVRAEYFPVYYVEPLLGNEKALGYDLGSHPRRLAALRTARDSGELIVTDRMTLLQETGRQFSILFVAPVYKPESMPKSIDERRENLIGFVLGVFRIAGAMTQAAFNLSSESGKIDINIYDWTSPPGQRVLYRSDGQPVEHSENEDDANHEVRLSLARAISVGGRDWTIVARGAISEFLPKSSRWQSLAGGGAIFLISILLAAYLWSGASRTETIRRMVAMRTAELDEANDRLRLEAEERRHIAKLVEDRAAKTRAIVENALDGIVAIDSAGAIETFNPAAVAMFGYSASEAIGRNIKLLLPPPHCDAHDTEIAAALESGAFERIGAGKNVTGRCKDGSLLPIDLLLNPVQGPHGQRFIGILRDITEQKKIEAMKNEFVSTVSHELRTPLTSIQGSLGLLRSGVAGELPPRAKAMIEIGYNNCERLVRLINDILDIEKIESGKIVYDFRPLDLATLIRSAIEANAAYGEKYGVRFVVTDAPTLTVRGDHDRLTQVLTNLLSNAAKFSPNGEDVVVSCVREGSVIRISVGDRGPGIPVEFRSRIFQKFAQADASDSRQKGGTGLGLSICRAIVEDHGGQIGFETETDKGTTFHFQIPIWKESPERSHGGAEHKTGRQILYVEDDPDIVAVISELTRGIASVVAVPNRAAARRMIAEKRFDLILLDLMLPDGSGERLLPHLPGSPNAMTPVIVFTSMEVPKPVAEQVRAVLVKSRVTNGEIARVIAAAMAPPAQAA